MPNTPNRGDIVNPRRRGIYESVYGNAVFVSGPNAKTGYDLDMGERVPISEVRYKWLRAAENSDLPGRY